MNQVTLAWAAFKNMIRAALRDPVWALAAISVAPFAAIRPIFNALALLGVVTLVFGFGGATALNALGFEQHGLVMQSMNVLLPLVLLILAFRLLTNSLILHFGNIDQQTHGSARFATGRILKVILFGSYSRGGWVEDHKSGYRSDYDILVVVNMHSVAEENELWHDVSDHFLRELLVTKTIETPVNVIVHTLQDVNDQLARGKPFFIDIIRDGIVLYEKEGHPFVAPKPLSTEAAREEAKGYYERWFTISTDALRGAKLLLNDGIWRHGSFLLHQATEEAYHCILLVLTLYSPKSHRLKFLRSSAERIEPRLIEAWPRDTKFARRCFERLDRAYVDARYSPHYEVTEEELRWLIERIQVLQNLIEKICREKLERPAS